MREFIRDMIYLWPLAAATVVALAATVFCFTMASGS